MKIMYGNSNFIEPDDYAFNFSGLRENIHQLPLLPPNDLGAISEKDFDMKYMNYLLGDDYRLAQIVMLLQTAMTETIYLLISEDEWGMILIESFLKMLSARYGITATYIQSWEDREYAAETNFNPFYGIRNFDLDALRVLEYGERLRIQVGGRIYE